MKAIIYHNPRCSKSRQALQLLKENQCDVTVVEYLKNPPDADTLQTLAEQMQGGVRTLLRDKEPEYKEWNLNDAAKTDVELLDALLKQPKLLNRPVVVVGDTAIVARPPELVLELVR